MSIQTSLFKRDLALVHTFSSSVHGVSCEFDIIREPCKPKVPSFASEQRDDLVDVKARRARMEMRLYIQFDSRYRVTRRVAEIVE